MPPAPVGLSDDGSVVAGYFIDNYNPSTMYLWNAAGALTTATHTLSAAGTVLDDLLVDAVSGDGSTLVGDTQNPNGAGRVGWLLPLR